FNHVKIKLNDALIDVTGKLEKNWDVDWQINIPDLAVLIPESAGSLSTSGTISGPLWAPTIRAIVQGKKLFYENQEIAQLNGEASIVVQPKVNSTLRISATGLNINDYP